MEIEIILQNRTKICEISIFKHNPLIFHFHYLSELNKTVVETIFFY